MIYIYFHYLKKLLSIVLKVHAFVLTWVTDDAMGQGDFIDYKEISFVIFSYVFKLNGFVYLLRYKKGD